MSQPIDQPGSPDPLAPVEFSTPSPTPAPAPAQAQKEDKPADPAPSSGKRDLPPELDSPSSKDVVQGALFGKKDDPKPADPKPDDPAQKPDESKPDSDPITDDLPPRTLREKLEMANARINEITSLSQAEKEDLSKRLEDAIRERDAQDAKLKEIEERRGMLDPSQHPEVQRMRSERVEFETAFQQKVRRMVSDIGGEEAAQLWGSQGEAFGALVRQYEAVGQVGDDGYAERHAAFKESLEDRFPESHRQVISALRDGADAFATSRRMEKKESEKLAELASKGASWQEEEERKQFEAIQANYRTVEKQWFSPTDEQIESAPDSARVLLKKLIESSPETAERAEGVKKMLRDALTPLAPLSAEQLGSLSPEDANAMMERRVAEKRAVQQRVQAFAGEAYLALALVPSLMRQVQELREFQASHRDGTPQPSAPGSDLPRPHGGDENKTARQILDERIAAQPSVHDVVKSIHQR